jgi:transposase
MSIRWRELGTSQRREVIIYLRNLGLNQHEIAEYLSCHWSSINSFCGAYSIKGWKHGGQYGNENAKVTGFSKQSVRKYTQKAMTEADQDLYKCERCGYISTTTKLGIHHKDRDRLNNSIDNLEVLCSTCHASHHIKERNRDDYGRLI